MKETGEVDFEARDARESAERWGRGFFYSLMSQKKRLSSGGSGSGGISPSMISASKKPKQQQQSGLPVDHFEKHGMMVMATAGGDDTSSPDMMMDVLDEHLTSGGSYPAGPTSAMSLSSGPGIGTTANLSRKKATPPQPVKKLVIKPFKGAIDVPLRNCHV